MKPTIDFKLVTPDRTLFEEEVVSVTVPTQQGEITILPEHIPLVAPLADGVAELRRPDGSIDEVAVSEGFIHVKPGNKVTILAEMAERGADVDLETIEKAKALSEKMEKEEITHEDILDASSAAGLSRELARYKAAMRYQKRTGGKGMHVGESAS
ncbi:MAG: ATP synthase F1 subunit epsilon [Patescibacteria group bacterium]